MKTDRVTDATACRSSSRRTCEVERARRGRAADADSASSELCFDQLHFELIYLLAEERTLRLDLAAAFLGIGAHRLRPVVDECVSAGLLTTEAFLRDEPEKYPWIWMTRVGLHAGGVNPRYYYVPTVAILKHTRGVHKIRLHCASEYPDHVWVSERELSSRNSRSEQHLADGALERDGQLIPIEYERTPKDPYRLVRNMCELVNRHSEAFYFCSEETRRRVEEVARSNRIPGVRIFDLPKIPGIA